MQVTFPKVRAHDALALFEWRDGSAATTRTDSRERLPHDLTHYAPEAHFQPPYGFWSLAARQAPFSSLTLVRGRWPRSGLELLARARKKHGAEMLKAEAVNLAQLADPCFDLESHWPVLRRTLERAYAFGRSNPFAGATKGDFEAVRARYVELDRAWARVPWGGGLRVFWPPDRRSEVLPAVDPLEGVTAGPRRRR